MLNIINISLAKAFDEFCKKKGYEKALPIMDEWLKNNNPNTRRAVTEGLRYHISRKIRMKLLKELPT